MNNEFFILELNFLFWIIHGDSMENYCAYTSKIILRLIQWKIACQIMKENH